MRITRQQLTARRGVALPRGQPSAARLGFFGSPAVPFPAGGLRAILRWFTGGRQLSRKPLAGLYEIELGA
jgi:hypothetical protein